MNSLLFFLFLSLLTVLSFAMPINASATVAAVTSVSDSDDFWFTCTHFFVFGSIGCFYACVAYYWTRFRMHTEYTYVGESAQKASISTTTGSTQKSTPVEHVVIDYGQFDHLNRSISVPKRKLSQKRNSKSSEDDSKAPFSELYCDTQLCTCITNTPFSQLYPTNISADIKNPFSQLCPANTKAPFSQICPTNNPSDTKTPFSGLNQQPAKFPAIDANSLLSQLTSNTKSPFSVQCC